MRFFRRIKLLPGVTLNISTSGLSVSIGIRGARATFGKDGRRGTLGIPGSGLSHSWFRRYGKQSTSLGEQVVVSPEEPGDIPCNWYIGDLIKFYQHLPQQHPLWQAWGVGVVFILSLVIAVLTAGKGLVIIAVVTMYITPVALIAGLLNPALVRQTSRIAAVWVPLMYWISSFVVLLIIGVLLRLE